MCNIKKLIPKSKIKNPNLSSNSKIKNPKYWTLAIESRELIENWRSSMSTVETKAIFVELWEDEERKVVNGYLIEEWVVEGRG